MTLAAVVLAAGAGTRFEGASHKLVTPFRGKPMVCWSLEAAVAIGADAVLVVTGAVDLSGLMPAGAEVVVNPRWAEGQATSLVAAIDAARAAGHDAVVVGLGDQPLIPAEAWRLVAASHDTPIAVATYGGQRRNPVRLGSGVWDLLPREGDEGARRVLRSQPHLVTEVPCPGEPVDVDTEEDLARWS